MPTSSRNIRFRQVMLFSPFLLCFCLPSATTADENDEYETTKAIAKDLELYQGAWELLHGGGDNGPTTRSVKTINGNKSKVQRYDIDTGKLLRQHDSTFELAIEGGVRVHRYRIHREGGGGISSSFIYKVDEDHFYEVNGFLLANEQERFQFKPNLVRWKRIAESAAPAATRDSSVKQ